MEYNTACRVMTERVGLADSRSWDAAVRGVCSAQCMLSSAYSVLGVYPTPCMLYSVYAVLGVCCTRCMLYSVLTVDYSMER
jgi:hypothetical protein